MMKFKCQDCHAVFTEDEAGSERDFVGYYGNQSAYQYYMVCPECGSDCIDDYYGNDEDEDYEDED